MGLHESALILLIHMLCGILCEAAIHPALFFPCLPMYRPAQFCIPLATGRGCFLSCLLMKGPSLCLHAELHYMQGSFVPVASYSQGISPVAGCSAKRQSELMRLCWFVLIIPIAVRK